jgi:tetrahydromethanopterin S-methyltransferase subunit F
MVEINKMQNVKKEAVLVSQIRYTAQMIHHNAGSGIIDCQAGMFQNIFEDSAVAKVYDIRFVFSICFVCVQMLLIICSC